MQYKHNFLDYLRDILIVGPPHKSYPFMGVRLISLFPFFVLCEWMSKCGKLEFFIFIHPNKKRRYMKHQHNAGDSQKKKKASPLDLKLTKSLSASHSHYFSFFISPFSLFLFFWRRGIFIPAHPWLIGYTLPKCNRSIRYWNRERFRVPLLLLILTLQHHQLFGQKSLKKK